MRLGIMCGLQCSGKSTKAKEMMKDGWVVLNPDTFRQVYSGTNRTKLDSPDERKVWACIHLSARGLLAYGHDVLIDGVFGSKWSRESWVNMAKDFNTELEIYLIPFDLELSLKRNRKIGRFCDGYGTPSDKVIMDTARGFQTPEKSEGKIIIVDHNWTEKAVKMLEAKR